MNGYNRNGETDVEIIVAKLRNAVSELLLIDQQAAGSLNLRSIIERLQDAILTLQLQR